jgi:hypothetical protein
MTGLYCTGCGTLRAVRALIDLDPGTAWAMNPLAVLLAPFAVASWAAWVRRAATGAPRRWLAPPWAVVATGALVVVFTVARNLPAFEWLAPG